MGGGPCLPCHEPVCPGPLSHFRLFFSRDWIPAGLARTTLSCSPTGGFSVTSRRLALVLPLLALSCASKPPRDLLVTSFTGRSGEDAAEPIRFRFNRAVVA